MKRWHRRRSMERMGILLIGGGCLFFFLVLADVETCMMQVQNPYVLYTGEENGSLRDALFELGLGVAMPLSAYAKNINGDSRRADGRDEEDLWASIAAQAEHDRRTKSRDEKEEEADAVRKMQKENERARRSVSENDAKGQTGEADDDREEADAADGREKPFQRRLSKVYEVDMDACRDFEELVKTFYVIDSSTYIGEDELNIALLTGQDLSVTKNEGQGPQILIYHTHSQEGYADSVPGDDSTTVMGAGEELARILTEEYGFRVLHHMGKYDVANRDYAYSEALPGLKKVLEDNPTIEVVIDLHRDGVAESTRLVTELDGKRAAQVMLFNGLSRTKRIGEIEYLKNDHRQTNLAFSFQLQKHMMEYYPGLSRKIYLKGYRYNMHFCPRSLLIELGAQTNTREEVWNALEPLAHCIAMVLEGE